MKVKLILILFFQFILFNSFVYSDEVEIISDNIKILDDGKIIESIQTNAIIKKKGLYIEGDYSKYDKEKETIEFEKNVLFNDRTKNITVDDFGDVLFFFFLIIFKNRAFYRRIP